MHPARESAVILLDACVVINLYACDQMKAVAQYYRSFYVVDVVFQETMYVRRGGTGGDADERDQVDLTRLAGAGELRIASPADENELNTFIDLTRELDDGEAMTLAIALHRGYAIATDDRKAVRLADGRVPVLGSLDLMRDWAEDTEISGPALRRILGDVRDRGRYIPRKGHPLRSWWDDVMASK